MRRFMFRFQRVLETKQYLEEVKKNELAAFIAQRLEDERRLFAVQGELLDAQAEWVRRAEARDTMPDIVLYQRYFHTLAEQIRCCQKLVEQWDAQIETKREELVEAKRETKVLEKLKDGDRRAYDKAVADWEQKLIDEVAVGRHTRDQREAMRR